ncbi:hypothetical protein MUK42_16168 [Musa troglodytarum]|uniref:Uncharacterized protein n=2 Tax=Musa troglodytarum TaxID=320322 RepID=A0A9E7L0R2_9LILI|nr:hypothetical protein MUK42_16168 [Musa troglodytarum]
MRHICRVRTLNQLECDGSCEPISDLAAGGIALKHAVRDVIMEVGFRCHATSAHMVEALALLEGFKQARRCLQHFESTRIPSRFIAQIYFAGRTVQKLWRAGRRAGRQRVHPVLSGTGQNRVCPTGSAGPARGSARFGSVRLARRLGSARLRLVGSARPGPARLGSARPRRLGRSHANNASDTVDSATPGRGIVGMRNAGEGGEASPPPSLFARLHRTLDLLSHLTVQKHLKLIPFEFLECVSSTCASFCFLEKMVVSG